MDQVQDLWKPVIGRLAWGICRVHGSIFFIEFGSPHLFVREPRVSRSDSAKVRRLAARRLAHLAGDWHFSVVYGDWTIRTAHGTLDSETSAGSPADDCLVDLQGQRLVSVEAGKLPNSCRWTFDLGGVLEVWPSTELPDDQWTLHPWNGEIAVFRHDGSLIFAEAAPVKEEH
jgi:hypothetical protein